MESTTCSLVLFRFTAYFRHEHASDAVRDRVEDYISALDTYADREGHVDVPLDHVEGNLALGRWCFGT